MDDTIMETKKLLTEEQANKIKSEFEAKPDVVKGKCFDEVLDKID